MTGVFVAQLALVAFVAPCDNLAQVRPSPRSAVILDVTEELLYSVLRRHHQISHLQLPCSFYVKRVEGKKLVSPVIKRKNASGEIDLVARARDADLHVDVTKGHLVIRMHFGVTLSEKREAGQDVAALERTNFDHLEFRVPLPPNFLFHLAVMMDERDATS